MVSKILFVVLLGCAVVYASPINRDVAESSEDKSIQHLSVIENILNQIFGKLFEQIGGAIKESLEVVFKKIGDKLNSEEYLSAIEELKTVLEEVFKNEEKLDKDEESKKAIEEQLEKVGIEFEKIIKEAADKIEKQEEGKVDAGDFKKAVDDLKEVVDKILSK